MALPKEIRFRNADDSVNTIGAVTHRVEANFVVGGYALPTNFYVADLGRDDAILGNPWIRTYNPTVNWETGTFKFDPKIITKQQHTQEYRKTHEPPPGIAMWGLPYDPQPDHSRVIAYIQEDEAIQEKDQWKHSTNTVLTQLWQTLSQPQIRRVNKSTELAIQAQETKVTKSLDELLPQYLHPYRKVFEKASAERLPESKPWDHAIDLKPDFVPKDCKVYDIPKTQMPELDKFLEENLAKGYIRPSKSPIAAPFFFVKKKDGTLRPVQDYRELNSGTVKNAYPLPRIPDLIDKLKDAQYFTKLDVRAGYNNVRIKKGDEWKAAFKTARGLFEPTVMFFGLCNAPATFQALMNDIFRDFLTEGWIVVYMDDILIFSPEREVHRQRTEKVVKRLAEHDLYLKAEKCEFETQETEFLGAIIRPGEVAMDPVKLQGIRGWTVPEGVKDVQSFLGFGNFYRRFIPGFSHITKPLTELTRKGQPWIWSDSCQQAFDELKARFQAAPILQIPDAYKPFQVECDASKVASGAVLRQKGSDGIWHPCAYLSKAFTETERNYQIYDRELLAIIRALEAWRHYLEGAPHPIQILSDHKNLTYFRSAQKLNRRQARWSIYLSQFNIQLIHQPGKTLVQADALSRRPDHNPGDHDNEDVTMLPEELFVNAVHTELQERIRNTTSRDTTVMESLNHTWYLKKKPLIGSPTDWDTDDGIVLFKDKVYVPPDQDLRRDVVKDHHDPAIMGHPGIQKTYELVSREYWWPGLRKFVTQYVKGCATCQVAKVNTHPTKPPMMPIPHSGNTRPFGTITMDYVTGLPDSDGYDAIQVVVDHDVTKAIVLSPCTKTTDAMQTAHMLARDVYSRFGLPDRIISDRGPQFISKAYQELNTILGIKGSLSTSHHPQTDGQSERTIQEIEVALRIYCGNYPDTWSQLLPQFEFAHNQRQHSSSGRSPFEVLMGYQPKAIASVHPRPKHPSTEERLAHLHELRENSIASHEKAAAAMAKRRLAGQPTFKKGDKVLLESSYLSLPYPNRKMAPKREGPFVIEEVLGPVTVRLKLPATWKIHPVFHVSLITPYHTTAEHGPNYVTPPPETIEGEEEWELEAIINHRKPARGGIQYLVTWKGRPPFENEWLRERDLKHAQTILQAYKRRHKMA